MFVSPITQMISHNGLSVRMVAGVARHLHAALIPRALTLGVVPEGESEAASAPLEGELTVEAVAAAIRELMADGDAKVFGATGEPKLAPLRAKAGKGVTDELRDAAWAIVKGEV